MYRGLERGERWENPRAWLYSVASRLAIDAHRRRKLIEWLPLLGTEPSPVRDPEAVVVEQLAVQEALNALAPKCRIPLLLYVYEEWKVREIAEMLDLSVSAIKMRLFRAREQFRHAYGQRVETTQAGAAQEDTARTDAAGANAPREDASKEQV